MLEVNRKELKYRLNAVQVPALRRRLAPFLLTDRHGGPEGYTVRSVYFDTLWDSDFLDKVDGCDCRQKIRLRIYGAGGPIKLELKQKEGGFQRKRSLTITEEEARALMAGDCAAVRSLWPASFIRSFCWAATTPNASCSINAWRCMPRKTTSASPLTGICAPAKAGWTYSTCPRPCTRWSRRGRSPWK